MGKALVVGTRSGSGEALAATKQTAAAALSLAQENIVRDAIEASHVTRRVYASAWGRFAAWCEAQYKATAAFRPRPKP